MFQQPKYESYFIINNRRQYETSTPYNNSIDTSYQSARQKSIQMKRLPVTARCHKVLWENNTHNSREKENHGSLTQLRTYYTGRRVAEQQFITAKRQSLWNVSKNLVNIENSSRQYHHMPVTANNKYTSAKPRVSLDFEHLTESINVHNILSNNTMQSNPLQQSVMSSVSNSTSNKDKKSKLKLYKEQLQASREQQVIKTEFIKSQTEVIKQQINSSSIALENVTPLNDLSRPHYNDEHEPHRLIFNDNNNKPLYQNENDDHKYVINIKQNHINHLANISININRDINTRSMIVRREHDQGVKDQMNKQQGEMDGYFTRGSSNVENVRPYPVANIFTHQSLIMPTNNIQRKQHNQTLTRQQTLITHLLTPSERQIDPQSQSSFQKVTDLNPKPCESFIMQPTSQQRETVAWVKVQDPNQQQQQRKSLENYYDQELKRREEANEILRSLISRQIVDGK